MSNSYIPRAVEPLGDLTVPGKVLVLYGPRRVGKTTLLQSLPKQFPNANCRFETGDDISTQLRLSEPRLEPLLRFTERLDMLIVDEAQNIPNIGKSLKLIIDHRPDLRLVVSGSASFTIASQVGEPLTGRYNQVTLYPIAFMELLGLRSGYELDGELDRSLVYGSYPDVVTAVDDTQRREYLQRLVESYLLKDVLAFERVRSPKKVVDLLRLLAYQVGSEVSDSELASQLGVATATVQRYLDLFEKTFIIFRLGGYSGNLRGEVRSKHKYYFYDTGVRNAVIANFAQPSMRGDMGALWENFCVVERRKYNAYGKRYATSYFWRTYGGQEIDYLEAVDGRLQAYEFKYSAKKLWRPPSSFTARYSDATSTLINPATYQTFIAGNTA